MDKSKTISTLQCAKGHLTIPSTYDIIAFNKARRDPENEKMPKCSKDGCDCLAKKYGVSELQADGSLKGFQEITDSTPKPKAMTYEKGVSCTKQGKEHQWVDKGGYFKCPACGSSKTKRAPAPKKVK